jgi:hypothetical protein
MTALETMFPGIDLPPRVQRLTEGGPGSGPHPGFAKDLSDRAKDATAKVGDGPASKHADNAAKFAAAALDAHARGDSSAAKENHAKAMGSHERAAGALSRAMKHGADKTAGQDALSAHWQAIAEHNPIHNSL